MSLKNSLRFGAAVIAATAATFALTASAGAQLDPRAYRPEGDAYRLHEQGGRRG
jgi:hypothetical protein